MKVDGQYGKTRVRVVRVIRHDASNHDLTEVEVECLLDGKLTESYTKGDNSSVVPTDTIKNTVYALAKKSCFKSIEDLGIALCRHFISKHGHIERVSVELTEKLWRRVVIDGTKHDHAFTGDAEVRTARVSGLRSTTPEKSSGLIELEQDNNNNNPEVQIQICSGIKDLKIMKTTQSGFENYIVDNYTTLQPCTDRIFCTLVTTEWQFDSTTTFPQNFLEINQRIRDLVIRNVVGPPKGGEYSKSVQETMYKMAINILQEVPSVVSVSAIFPNIHHFLYDLERFHIENNGTIYYPTDDPSGLIKCRVSRDDMIAPLLCRM